MSELSVSSGGIYEMMGSVAIFQWMNKKYHGHEGLKKLALVSFLVYSLLKNSVYFDKLSSIVWELSAARILHCQVFFDKNPIPEAIHKIVKSRRNMSVTDAYGKYQVKNTPVVRRGDYFFARFSNGRPFLIVFCKDVSPTQWDLNVSSCIEEDDSRSGISFKRAFVINESTLFRIYCARRDAYCLRELDDNLDKREISMYYITDYRTEFLRHRYSKEVIKLIDEGIVNKIKGSVKKYLEHLSTDGLFVILIHGKPGVGKTMLSNNLFQLFPETNYRMVLTATSSRISELVFSYSSATQSNIFVIDEVDKKIPQTLKKNVDVKVEKENGRSSTDEENYAKMLEAFTVGINTRDLLIMTTNCLPKEFREEFVRLGRVNLIIEMLPPSKHLVCLYIVMKYGRFRDLERVFDEIWNSRAPDADHLTFSDVNQYFANK